MREDKKIIKYIRSLIIMKTIKLNDKNIIISILISNSYKKAINYSIYKLY